MKKSLSQLKKDAKTKSIKVNMILRHGKPVEEGSKLFGTRTIVSSNSNSISIENEDGEVSSLHLPKAALVDYSDKELVIYNAGLRDLTPEEKAIKDGFETIRDRKQEEIDVLTDSSVSYWQEKHYYEKNDAIYLMGNDTQRGMRYDYCTKQVRDENIRGEICLKYEIVG